MFVFNTDTIHLMTIQGGEESQNERKLGMFTDQNLLLEGLNQSENFIDERRAKSFPIFGEGLT